MLIVGVEILVLMLIIGNAAPPQKDYCSKNASSNLSIEVVELPNPCNLSINRCVVSNQLCYSDEDCQRERDVIVTFKDQIIQFPFHGYMMNFLPWNTKMCFTTETDAYFIRVNNNSVTVREK